MADAPLSSERKVFARVKQSDPRYDEIALARILHRSYNTANGCWRWKGTHTPTGYGLAFYRGENNNVHRIIYQLYHRVKLTTEQYVLHRCDVRDCLNPDHLWVGSQHDNNTDCAKKGRHYEGSRKYCERGHPLFGDNVRIGKQYKKGGGIRRSCKACERFHAKKDAASGKALARQRRRRARQRAQEQRA